MLDGAEEQSFELDFSKGVDSKQNEVNLLRLYAAILAGYTVRISTSENVFELDSGEDGEIDISPYLVAHISRAGCFIFNEYANPNDYRYNDIEMRLNTMIEGFFRETDASRSSITNANYLHLPYSHPYALFDILFMARARSPRSMKSATVEDLNKRREITHQRRYKIINEYVNFEKLDKIMERKQHGNEKDREQYRKWDKFLKLYEDPNLANVKIDNVPKLIAFIDSVIIFQGDFDLSDESMEDIDLMIGASIDPNLVRISNDAHRLYYSLSRGVGAYINPEHYEVDPEFHEALYLNGYLK